MIMYTISSRGPIHISHDVHSLMICRKVFCVYTTEISTEMAHTLPESCEGERDVIFLYSDPQWTPLGFRPYME